MPGPDLSYDGADLRNACGLLDGVAGRFHRRCAYRGRACTQSCSSPPPARVGGGGQGELHLIHHVAFRAETKQRTSSILSNHPPCYLIDRLRKPLYSMTGVDAEHRLFPCIFSMENARALFAFPTLTFLRYRREHFECIEFVKLLDQNAIRDRLRQRSEDGGVDRSDYGSAFVAFERDLLPVRFGHNAADAIDASTPMGNDGEM
jgi:hypothetical protein